MKLIVIEEQELRELVRQECAVIVNEIKKFGKYLPEFDDKRMCAKEAADFLGISLSTLYKNTRMVPHRKFGKRLLFSKRELTEFTRSAYQIKKAVD
jgi:hypothetical protein